MSMADDNTRRSYRSHDAYQRNANQADAPEQSFGGSDPLAELARLIGQNDPFADTTRRQPQASAPRAQRGYDDPNDWRRHVQRPNFDAPEQPAYYDRRYAADQQYASDQQYAADQQYTSDQQYASDQHYAAADPHAGYADHDPYQVASTQPQQDHYADPHAGYRRDPSYTADYPDEPIHAGAPHHADRIGAQPHGGGTGGREDEGYDDPPRRARSGSSLVTAVILIGCAMLGTAGAYGYRTYATSPGGNKQAPVIIADSAPSKIVPAEQKTARSQDRVGAQGNNEQLVSREEQPVTLPGTASVPRVVFPSPIQPGGGGGPPPTTTGSTPPRGGSPSPSASNAQSPSAATADQPKRIRTVTIRPDGGDASGQPAANEPSARGAPSPSARNAPPPAQPAPRASRDQPLSLDPNAPAPQANERPQPQQRPLTPPAPRETAAPAPNARVAAAPASGGFLVQVSSQKSEADAQSSYRALQSKYSQLKAHQPVIRRADLGNKGVFYRAMVGPFESGDEAVQFCNGLKQAGGQCIIHRN
jgi:hypothetical protein